MNTTDINKDCFDVTMVVNDNYSICTRIEGMTDTCHMVMEYADGCRLFNMEDILDFLLDEIEENLKQAREYPEKLDLAEKQLKLLRRMKYEKEAGETHCLLNIENFSRFQIFKYEGLEKMIEFFKTRKHVLDMLGIQEIKFKKRIQE